METNSYLRGQVRIHLTFLCAVRTVSSVLETLASSSSSLPSNRAFVEGRKPAWAKLIQFPRAAPWLSAFPSPTPRLIVSLSLSLAQTKHFLVWTCCWGCSFAVTETKHRHKLTSLLQTLILLRSRSHSQSPVYLSLSLYCLDSTSES